MWKTVLGRLIDLLHSMINHLVLSFSFLLGLFLSAIGYPKEALSFVFWLIIIDLLSKHYAITVVRYGRFTLMNYFYAWRDKHLTSRGMKNGLGVKTLLYCPILFIAHKLSIIPEAVFGSAISNILYSLLMIIEITSILENLSDAGHKEVSPLVRLFKKKKDEMFKEDEKD